MATKTLVTGGSGYFGCVIVQRLVERGDEVSVLDLRDVEHPRPGVRFNRGDIRNPDDVRKAVEGIEVVHHNVAQVPLAKDREQFRTVNIDGVRVLLEAALDAGVRKVIAMSSSAIYGIPKDYPVTDSTPPSPLEEYGQAKLEAEHVVDEYRAKGLDVTLIRPRTIMGHGRLGIMQILFEWIYQGGPVPVFGRGDNIYQFVHGDDLADACIKASDRAGGSNYNIGAAQFGTMRETLEGLIKHAGTGSRLVRAPTGPAVAAMKWTSDRGFSPFAAYHWIMYGESMAFDLTRQMQELDWKPRYSNVEMFCQTYDDYVANRDSILSRKGASHHRSPIKSRLLNVASLGMRVLPNAA